MFSRSHLALCGPLLLAAVAGCYSPNSATAPNPQTSPQIVPVVAKPPLKIAKPSKTIAPSTAITRTEGVPNGIVTRSRLTIPRGFRIEILAQKLFVPRRMAFAPGATASKYDLFVSESKSNRISVLRVQQGRVVSKSTFTTSVRQPYGLAFWNRWLYVGNTDSVVRFPYAGGALKAGGAPQKIATLTGGGYNQHWTRNLLFDQSGKKLFVTVGSSCNSCEESDPGRAAISEMNPDGSARRVFASGLRNPVGLAWQPGTNNLWTVVNERDKLGDNVPPDYLTQVSPGTFYGWPYAYTDINGRIHPDPNFGAKRPGKVSATHSPTVPVQAHSAALGVAFYPTTGGNFPKEYRGDAFLSFHGSWNRSSKTGYKIVRVHFQNGKPVKITDFVQGFIEQGYSWGRPVDVQIAPDGSLLFSDDGGGKIWRVFYAGK